MEILFLITGLIIGAIIAYLVAKQKITANSLPKAEFSALQKDFDEIQKINLRLEVEKDSLEKQYDDLKNIKKELDENLKKSFDDLKTVELNNARLTSDNRVLNEKLENQKKELEELGKKFTTQFENLANKIFDEKSDKFTKTNKENIENLLKPLGENIKDFRSRVDEVYNKESKERFSLGEKVKELAALNETLSKEARDLTNALKTESQTQGGWGEMILEKILEMSGLRKGEEYFLQHQLVDESGTPLRSAQDNKKMRPDAVIKYPDKRSVIIDSKVSLTNFVEYMSATEPDIRKKELDKHVSSVRNHIDELSGKAYDDYGETLDFTMMFVPSEPAYIAALQGDPNLWEYAYKKRILLLSPVNLITALKLVLDLWKREYQNRNALAIAERGALLYEKFVGFVSSLENVGTQLNRADEAYQKAYKQLSTGNGHLIGQAKKLKELGIKAKGKLSDDLLEDPGETND